MSTALTSGSRDGFESHTNIKLWTLIIFAYGIQVRHTLLRWNPMSIATNILIKILNSNNNIYAQRLKVAVLATSTLN